MNGGVVFTEENIDGYIQDGFLKQVISDAYGNHGDKITEVDYNLVSGQVTKDEISERITQVVSILEDTLSVDLAGREMPQFTPDDDSDSSGTAREYMRDEEFGQRADTLHWLYREFFDGTNSDVGEYDSIAPESKSRIVTEVLGVFVEMYLNWPTQGYGNPWWLYERSLTRPSGGLTAPVIRTSAAINAMPSDVLRAMSVTKTSHEYTEYFDTHDGSAENMDLFYQDGQYYNHQINASNPQTIYGSDDPDNDAGESQGFDYDTSTYSDQYERHGFSPVYLHFDKTQNLILEYYLDRIGLIRVADYTRSSFTTGIFNLQQTEDQQLCNELGIKQFLNENVKCGFRLMTGHKVIRDDNLGESPAGTYPGRSDSTVYPQYIYNNFEPRVPLAQATSDTQYQISGIDSQIGINNGNPNIRNIHSRKKAFLGYAEPQDVVIGGSELLNSESIFYNNALEAIMKHQNNEFTNEFGTVSMNPTPPGFREAAVYSIPIDEVEFEVGCFNDLFAGSEPPLNYQGTFDMLDQRDNLSSDLLSKRRKVVRDGVHKFFESDGMRDLLSYENGNVIPFDSTDEDELNKQHRYLFDFLFPVRRYESLFMLQSSHVFDLKVEDNKVFDLTRRFILELIQQLNNPDRSQPDRNSEVRDLELRETAENNVGEIPKIDNMFVALGKMIKKLAPLAASGVTRNIANYVDPAYADMRRQYKEDPCNMASGLVGSLATSRPVGDFNYRLKKGFATFDGGQNHGCKIYVPVNNMPLDIIQSIDPNPIETYRNISNVVNLFTGLVTNSDTRYGYFLGPMGVIALSTMELPGEKHSKLRTDNECPECDDNRVNLLPAVGLCEDN